MLRLIIVGVVPAGLSVDAATWLELGFGIEFRCRVTDRKLQWRERALKVGALKDCGMRIKEIAERLGVSHQCISALLKKVRARM